MAQGRTYFNVSEWGYQKKNRGDEAVEEVQKGAMPPLIYKIFHSSARINPEEKQIFLKGLEATFRTEAVEKEGKEHK